MIAAALVLAAVADVGVVSVTPSKTEVRYDETFTVAARVRNHGPDAATDAFVTIGGNAPGVVLDLEAPAGWKCDSPGRELIACAISSMPAGAEAEFRVSLTAPQPTPIAYRVGAHAGSTGDTNAANNAIEIPIALLHPDRHADLGVTIALQANPVPPSGDIRATLDVRNAGPDMAHGVVVAIVQDFEARVTLTASGAGWTCEEAMNNVLCHRAQLAAGTSAPIAVVATAPMAETRVELSARVRAEANRDSENGNNIRRVTIGIGSAEAWERVLFPITTDFVAGAGGAAWTTEIVALILDDELPDFAPHPCELIQITCPFGPPPLRRQFDAFGSLLVPQTGSSGGQFFYMRASDAAKFRFNARIYDDARGESTAGAEVPAVRDGDFRSDVIALLNIPVRPEYRHTLRIYDDRSRHGAQVRIRVYSGDEVLPRVDVVRSLFVNIRQITTTALLPTHPAYAQAELSQLLPLAGLAPLRVEIEPVTPGVRLWAFVSVTNNETHHVTVVTPQ